MIPGNRPALFLVSAASVGYEIALTRYFAVSSWSEYGYWVISIVMVGLALSGVVTALARTWLVRHAATLLGLLPVLLIAAAALGYHATTENPFNPLQLQNAVTAPAQLGNIGLYYAELLPFFFLTGLFISLSFVINADRIGLVYGLDLTGAGAGALLVLALMTVVHPFQLVPVLLLPLTAAGFLSSRRFAAAALLALLCAEALLLLDGHAAYNDFKPIYAPLSVPDSRTAAQIFSPRGFYELLDDFTERVDTDVSNNAGLLGLPGPPTSYGLYRDGRRLAALPKSGGATADYAAAALDALPYRLRPRADVLLIGASGGFRLREALALGARHVTALEPEPVLLAALHSGLGPSPPFAADPRLSLSGEAPLAAVQDHTHAYTLIDFSGDFLDAAPANAYAFTTEAIQADLRALQPDGILSIPVSIREFPAYASRMLATVRRALLAEQNSEPAANIIVYRSAWNVRILLSPTPWSAADIAAVRAFCDERSFDVPYYPGINIAAARSAVYNDLPSVSFASGEVTSGSGPDDAVADEAGPVLRGEKVPSEETFNLAPITFDRPFVYDVLRLSQLPTILQHLDALPQTEIEPLVNLAVLLQAILFALLVLLVPLFAKNVTRQSGASLLRAILYFAGLGLGFLFIEIYLIERATFYLNDRTAGFSLVLTAMLICSGIGAMNAHRFQGNPRRAVLLCAAVVVIWSALSILYLQAAMLHTLAWPWGMRVACVMLLVAPVSIALGLPFPLGLDGLESSAMLPLAWGVNGAFSVVSTPLANLIALGAGFNRVLLWAAILYVSCCVVFPTARKSNLWRELSLT